MDAQTMTRALGGRWMQSYGRSPCPVCGGGTTSKNYPLSIAPSATQGVVVCCFKGCEWKAIKEALKGQGFHVPLDNGPPKMETKRDVGRIADRIWREAIPIAGTQAEAYLHGRAIKLTSHALRYHPRLWHSPGQQHQQAMVAQLGNGAIHRTFFEAATEPRKMMLGSCQGRAVRLWEGSGPLLVAEGIETALSISALGIAPHMGLWATLSTSGMKSLHLPDATSQLVIATDGDNAGMEAGETLAARADALGWDVHFLPAPMGSDWNDVLRGVRHANDEV